MLLLYKQAVDLCAFGSEEDASATHSTVKLPSLLGGREVPNDLRFAESKYVEENFRFFV